MKFERHVCIAIGLLAGGALARTQAPALPGGTAPQAPESQAPQASPPAEQAPLAQQAPSAAPAPEFHAALAPYGTWTTLAPYGEVWAPKDMPAGWRPYTSGHWVFADEAGWTWVADEPWGWAPFHYGRWALDATIGWVWIPGDVWAPAWVAWRQGPGVTGWAPLPPSFTWQVGFGFNFGNADLALAIADPWWSFVPVASLCHPRVREVLLVPERSVIVLHQTTIVHNLVLEHGRPVNRAIEVGEIETASGVPVQHVLLREVERPDAAHGLVLGANEVAIVRPAPPAEAPLAHAAGAPAPTRPMHGVPALGPPNQARAVGPAATRLHHVHRSPTSERQR